MVDHHVQSIKFIKIKTRFQLFFQNHKFCLVYRKKRKGEIYPLLGWSTWQLSWGRRPRGKWRHILVVVYRKKMLDCILLSLWVNVSVIRELQVCISNHIIILSYFPFIEIFKNTLEALLYKSGWSTYLLNWPL